MAIYEYCNDNSIASIIDLNERNGVNFKYKDCYTVGKDGIPVCQAGLKLIRDGIEKGRKRIKYRCANCYHKDGIHCDHKCSDSDYGLVVHTPTKDNPRFFSIPPRESKEWIEEYKKSKRPITGRRYVRQLESEPCADLILSHPTLTRK